MKIRYKIVFFTLGLFLLGGFFRVLLKDNVKTNYFNMQKETQKDSLTNKNEIILNVGENASITKKDVEFERLFNTEGEFKKEDGTLANFSLKDSKKVLDVLEQEILKEIVERKVLFNFAQLDPDFKSLKESVDRECSAELKVQFEKNDFLKSKDEEWRQRLLARNCEIALIKKYSDNKIYKMIDISKEEIEEFYQKNIDQFQVPEMVSVRHIVTANEKEANILKSKIKNSNFAELAKNHSISPEAALGGLLEPYKKGDMPPVFDIAFKMRVGDISNVQKSTYGFHIILLEQLHPARTKSLSESEMDIRKKLTIEKQNKEYQKWVNAALHTVKIDVPKQL